MNVAIVKIVTWFNKSFLYIFPTDCYLLLMFSSRAGGRARVKMETKPNQTKPDKVNPKIRSGTQFL